MADSLPADLSVLIPDLLEAARKQIAAAWLKEALFLKDSHAIDELYDVEAASMAFDSGAETVRQAKHMHRTRDDWDAAQRLLGTIAGEYIKLGTLDDEGLNSKLQNIANWLAARFHLNRSSFDRLVKECRATALSYSAAKRDARRPEQKPKKPIGRLSGLKVDADALRKLRERCELSQAELADKCDVSEDTIQF